MFLSLIALGNLYLKSMEFFVCLKRLFKKKKQFSHDILMATMLNGAAVMDAALLLIAGNESW